MRILYIYKEYKDRRSRYAQVMELLGNTVKAIRLTDKKEPGQVHIKDIKEHDPDLLFLLSPFYIANKVITDEAVDYCKARDIPIVCYSTFNTQVPYPEWEDTWKKFDIFFAQNRQLHNYLKSIGVESFYMPLAFYPDQYYPTYVDRDIPVSFMGSIQTTVPSDKDKRVKWLKALFKERVGLQVWGKGFNSRAVPANSYSSHSEQVKVYNRSQINIDLPFVNSAHPFYKNVFHLKNRFFEVPASKNFLLTPRCPEFEDILDDSMIGYCDDNVESMIEAINRYSKNMNLRGEMANRAYKEVIQKHTFQHRFKKMFEILRG